MSEKVLAAARAYREAHRAYKTAHAAYVSRLHGDYEDWAEPFRVAGHAEVERDAAREALLAAALETES